MTAELIGLMEKRFEIASGTTATLVFIGERACYIDRNGNIL